ncbi:hypothetical protein BDR04DRAFT_1121638 [Suillus decipiens]|nr:hypothetical protein BDR04DRAFT_1121638 [Suillus decipiens]
MCQHAISTQDLQQANVLLCAWEWEFELLYYQLREDCLHFVHPCIHQTNHLIVETIQKGPPVCYAQWTMERIIGNLGQEIRQPLQPYANLSEEGVRRCKVNTLLSIIPDLNEPPKGLPEGLVDLGDGMARDSQTIGSNTHVVQCEDVAIICLYSHPDEDLLQLSSQTVVYCSQLEDIYVIDVKQILSMVAIIPHTPRLPSGVTEA